MGLFGWGSADSDGSGYWAGGRARSGRPSGGHNSRTLRAQRLDAKARKASARGNETRASGLWGRADKAAKRGGWF
jgi:hypothetical protein